jgi:hypothetical protein
MAIARATRALVIIKQVAHDFTNETAEGHETISAEGLAYAIEAFAELEALSIVHVATPDVTRAAVCGSVKLAAIARGIGALDLVIRINGLLARLAKYPSPDPMARRAFAEASNDLMLIQANDHQPDAAIETYFEIAALSDTHSADCDLAGARAKAAANLIALTLETGRERVADQMARDLDALCRTFPNADSIRLQRVRGQFNRLAWTAQSGSPEAAIALMNPLCDLALGSPTDPTVVDLASEAAFILVTRLGNRAHHADALTAFGLLSRLAALSGSGEKVAGRLAEAAFNLITDLCATSRRDEAQLIYDDLAGLSVAEDDNATVRLAHAKAAANLAMTHEAVGDLVAADLLADDLKALVHAHPDDMAVFEIAALLDETD